MSDLYHFTFTSFLTQAVNSTTIFWRRDKTSIPSQQCNLVLQTHQELTRQARHKADELIITVSQTLANKKEHADIHAHSFTSQLSIVVNLHACKLNGTAE